jgi:hypothetical protein
LTFLNPYPLLVSSDNKGGVYIWAVKPAPNKGHLLHTYETSCSYIKIDCNRFENKSSGQRSIVSTMAWAKEDKTLYIGDESGHITVYNFTPLFMKEKTTIRGRVSMLLIIIYHCRLVQDQSKLLRLCHPHPQVLLLLLLKIKL